MQRTRAMTKAAFETAGSHAIATAAMTTDAIATADMITAQTTAQTTMNESDDVLRFISHAYSIKLFKYKSRHRT